MEEVVQTGVQEGDRDQEHGFQKALRRVTSNL